MITQENFFEPGDRVRLVTADGSVHKFRVTQIDVVGGLVIGKEESVPIADILAVETREVSWAKTAALLFGVFVVIGIEVEDEPPDYGVRTAPYRLRDST
jgi:hypothetical protein